jgi:hypothetical protein
MPTPGLDDAYNTLNMGLENRKNFDRYFVFTDTSAATELAQRIAIDKEPSKTLLTGIKGCGKTTELLRLLRDLEDKYFGVYIPMRADAEVRKVTAPDILLSGLLHLYVAACERGVTLNEHSVRGLATWMQETHPEVKIDFEDKGHEQKGLWEKVKRTLAILKAQKIRDLVQGHIEERKGDLVDKLNKLVAEVEAATHKTVLLAFDDLDKLPLDRAKVIFAENGELFAGPACKMIFTMPYSLTHTHEFREVSRLFKKQVRQGPMIVHGKESKDGMAEMRDIVAKRMSLDLLDGAALDALIIKTGGVVADLLRCTSESCVRARSEGKDKIDIKVVEAVLDDMKKDSSRTLGTSDCGLLSTIQKSKAADYNDTFLRLLDDGYILEYPGEEGNYYVHPLIVPVLKDRKLL